MEVAALAVATADAMHRHAVATHPYLADVQLSQLADAKHQLVDVLLSQPVAAKLQLVDVHHNQLTVQQSLLCRLRHRQFLCHRLQSWTQVQR